MQTNDLITLSDEPGIFRISNISACGTKAHLVSDARMIDLGWVPIKALRAEKPWVVLVDNTHGSIRMFEKHFIALVKDGTPLPEEIADLFEVKIIEVDGKPRGIVNFA